MTPRPTLGEPAGRSWRSRIEGAKPQFLAGVRAAVATLVPYYLAEALHEPSLAWVALGGWFGSLADPGGARRTRALAALAFVGLGGIAVTAAQLASSDAVAAPLAVGAIAFAASLAPALGSNLGSVGTMIALAASVAAAHQGGSPRAGLMFALGGAWAALTSTVLWPVWTHAPLRLAAARAYERLADYADAIGAAAPGDWEGLGRSHQRAVRTALEAARAAALAVRARRGGESPIGANLRVLVGEAEELFFDLIALAEAVEHQAPMPANLGAALRAIADGLYSGRASDDVPLGADSPVERSTRAAADVARDLHRARASRGAMPGPPARVRRKDLLGALSPRGPLFVHAVRIAVLGAGTVALARAVAPEHPSWIPVSAMAVLQPYLGPTFLRAVERVIGTTLGAAVALAILATVHRPEAIVALLFPLSVAAVMTRTRSYRLFVLFLTPVFVLLTGLGATDWHIVLDRIADVAIGGACALAIAGIAPSLERPRLTTALDGVLAALAGYAELARQRRSSATFAAARRALGLAFERAEGSVERLLAEPRAPRARAEDAMYLVTYARRVASAITTTLEAGGTLSDEAAAYLGAVTADLRAAIARREGVAARPPPVPTSAADGELFHRIALLARASHHP